MHFPDLASVVKLDPGLLGVLPDLECAEELQVGLQLHREVVALQEGDLAGCA